MLKQAVLFWVCTSHCVKTFHMLLQSSLSIYRIIVVKEQLRELWEITVNEVKKLIEPLPKI